MATATGIGNLISQRPDIRGGRPCIAVTGVSVRRIAQWHNLGQIPEEIVETFWRSLVAGAGACGPRLLLRRPNRN
jgi:uncharacterized protein (DUF433 family)